MHGVRFIIFLSTMEGVKEEVENVEEVWDTNVNGLQTQAMEKKNSVAAQLTEICLVYKRRMKLAFL